MFKIGDEVVLVHDDGQRFDTMILNQQTVRLANNATGQTVQLHRRAITMTPHALQGTSDALHRLLKDARNIEGFEYLNNLMSEIDEALENIDDTRVFGKAWK